MPVHSQVPSHEPLLEPVVLWALQAPTVILFLPSLHLW